MSRTQLVLLAAGGSAALLIGAWTFQALGYAPCKLCYWQRWPHMAAVVIGVAALLLPGRIFALLGGLAALTTAGVGLYHTGVEKKWWEGPSSCSGGGDGLSGLSGADLISTDVVDKVIMCDEVAWEFLTLSMASWNMLASLVLAGLWFAAFRKAT